jgi:hypothetical protein
MANDIEWGVWGGTTEPRLAARGWPWPGWPWSIASAAMRFARSLPSIFIWAAHV